MYASTREDELALLPWDVREKETFLRMQFAARDRGHREAHPQASRDVVLVDGRPGGRLDVDRCHDPIEVIDVALLPPLRGRGIGTALLRAVLAEADGDGRSVQLHVGRTNPAQRLYRRLGFELAGDDGVYLRLIRGPGSGAR